MPEPANERQLVFLGPIRRPNPAAVGVALREATSVGDLLERLGYPLEHRRFIRVGAAGALLRLSDPLPAAGEIVLSVPMGGG